MSIAFERSSGDSIQNSAYIHRIPPRFLGGVFREDQRFPAVERRREEEEDDDSTSSSSSSSSSSIVRNNDEESEVDSSFKGPLDTMNTLEEVLPIKRGISKFYNGKSKSFTSLADASSASSIKDFVKPENPYTRKRKNLLARKNLWDDKNHNRLPRDNGSCIPKRPATSNRSAVARDNKREDNPSMSSSTSSCLPPLHPHGKTPPSNESCSPPLQRISARRSFSLSDLQCAAAAATSNN
ncbi:protein OXIDATIVE STRESS 3 LIKE 2 [Ricinus communis]|uniref:MTD1 n=1 Tax=Ricinus communis TaxID=3988 RepID=B9RRA7_RICCO|nr:protein OXIDATIVE STRESS 3 LIKE 2 [Ricinus communis]EEF46278.1 conserved hypothetical protein [Ricinus communis]|eukprot:XP_002516276.1 uncharacterized protein LOC8281176 [Ricinus communis]